MYDLMAWMYRAFSKIAFAYIGMQEETGRREVTDRLEPRGGRVLVQGALDGPGKNVSVRVRAYAEGRLVGEETAPASWHSALAVVKLKEVVPWHPGKPFLYDLTLETLRDGAVLLVTLEQIDLGELVGHAGLVELIADQVRTVFEGCR